MSLVSCRNSVARASLAFVVIGAVACLVRVETQAAQPTIRSDAEYLIDTWETEDGLPENSATAMVQTSDGYLWFGMWNGLTRFDGVKFTVFNPVNTPQVPRAGIVNLHLDQKGRLWAGTIRGLAVRSGAEWRTMPVPGTNGNHVVHQITSNSPALTIAHQTSGLASPPKPLSFVRW